MTPSGVAAFDFDGTITQRDTLAPFLRRVGGKRLLGLPRRLPLAIRVGGHHRDRIKAALVAQVFEGRSMADVDAAGQAYAAALPERYRPPTLDRIGWHQEQGHRLVLVTASLGAYARPAAAALGFDDVIAVELDHADDVCTGRLAGPNVRGPEKAVRLRNLIGTGNELWAYGNSSGDDELLAMADHAVWIGRRADP